MCEREKIVQILKRTTVYNILMKENLTFFVCKRMIQFLSARKADTDNDTAFVCESGRYRK